VTTASASSSSRARLEGLSSKEAAERLEADGPNQLERRAAIPAWRVLLDQFANPLILLLLASAAVAAMVGAVLDASAIATIVSINAIVGFNQEYRAEKSVLALRSMTAARARVIREGRLEEIPASCVVRGDVLVLEAGDIVAADATLDEAHELSTVEAALTGESTPVRKSTDPIEPDTPLADRTNQVFLGTSVATGAGRAVVKKTGMHTQMGEIAGELAEPHDDTTPLQRRLAQLSRILLYICLAMVAGVAALGIIRGRELLEVLLTAVSLAVAAIPEGLPAVVTVALAVGVRRMSQRDVLIRRLSAVETLGSATVICTDKTGTLTTGVMTLREMWGPSEDELLRAAVACCDAELGVDGEGGTGDPTELAILRAAHHRGIERDAIEEAEPRIVERPFDAARRKMSVYREGDRLYVKGALEALLPDVTQGAEGAVDAAHAMAGDGLRVLAVAVGSGPEESELHLLGLVGIADAPREEASEAVRQAHAAGIRVVMITGDHPATAEAIGHQLGIIGKEHPAEEVVFARRTAADKTEIVKQMRSRGEIVAMTGDGVNDAPSIREADIGIAMGRTATEVTREASEMILTTDDLGGVVAAIREGRIIYANIRKTVVYLLGGNAAELVFMFIAAAMGLPMPLTPIQLLWINMLGEPLPGLTLSVDPAAADVLNQPPRPPGEPIMGKPQWAAVAYAALIHSVIVLGVFSWALDAYGLPTARTIAFTTFVFGVLLRSFAARSPRHIFWEVGALGNIKLLAVVVVSFALQLAIIYHPWTPGIFGVNPLTPHLLFIAFVLGLVPVTLIELTKLARRLLGR
jgi:Ca2+-transporting ATPase